MKANRHALMVAYMFAWTCAKFGWSWSMAMAKLAEDTHGGPLLWEDIPTILRQQLIKGFVAGGGQLPPELEEQTNAIPD